MWKNQAAAGRRAGGVARELPVRMLCGPRNAEDPGHFIWIVYPEVERLFASCATNLGSKTSTCSVLKYTFEVLVPEYLPVMLLYTSAPLAYFTSFIFFDALFLIKKHFKCSIFSVLLVELCVLWVEVLVWY